MKQLSKIRSQTVWIQILRVLVLYNLLHHLLTQFPHLLKETCCSVCSVMSDSLWPRELQHAGLPFLHNLPEFAQTHVHWVTDAIQPFHPLPAPSPPALNLSQHQVFPSESVLRIRWPKYWSFSFSIRHSSEHLGLISFRIDWLDLLAVQGNLKSLLQHHNSKTSILQCSAFFMIQLSNPYMTTGKTISLTIQTFVGKVTSVLFNTLSRFVIAFLPRSKHLWISWPQSRSTVILVIVNNSSKIILPTS